MAGVEDGLTKRGKTWSYVVRVPDPITGRSKPKWVGGFPTKDAAKEARDEARRSARRGEYVEKSRITVEEYLTGWLDGHSMEIKPSTLAGYREWMERHVYPRIGKMRLQAVRSATLTAMYKELSTKGGKGGKGLSPRSIEYINAILRKALNDAVKADRLIPSNPCTTAKRPRREVKPIGTIWSADELRTFLRLAESHRLYAFYRLSAYSGARRGELLYLRWSEVDWDRGAIHIRGTAGMVAGKRQEGTPKSGRERTVSLDAETLAVLREHRGRQRAEQEIAGDAWQGGDYVFTTGLGRPVPPDTVTNLISVLIRQHNEPAIPGTRRTKRQELPRPPKPLPHARLHDLRHVHATLLLTAGVPVHVVAERLGHADPAITLRVYAHVIRKHADEVANTFAAAVDGDTEAAATDPDDDDPDAPVPVAC
ncbi:tyrosine-type recombinase/integrase [Kribbella sp. NPDC050820]|uniref:tyrosine-type recombinase/integrase n=1 Tax=Kribbella sp. NPDC050820 TaxID=3155408 RepID=UPI0033E35217